MSSPPSPSLEEQFEAACAARDLPGAVLIASDVKGKFKYQRAFGPKSPTDDKLDINATFILASCTKLMTSIACLQCVERGQIGLDDDVSKVLTEIRDLGIITGWDEEADEPILKKAERTVTLRHLLTHTSGCGNERIHDLIKRWRAKNGGGSPRDLRLQKFVEKPLLFEPGTSWTYGCSTDWAGILVQRLNQMSLEAYMQKYIWDPLGIEDITFHQELKPRVRERLVTLTKRGDVDPISAVRKTDDKVIWTEEKLYRDPIEDEFGAGGAIASAVEFTKILDSICADDGRLLMSETIDEMFTPQLADIDAENSGGGDDSSSTGAQDGFAKWADTLATLNVFTSLPPGSKPGHGLAGLVHSKDAQTGVRAGTLSWSGLTNLLWTIDRESGLSLMYASNVVPFGDRKSHQMQQLFEKEMYRRFAEVQE